MLDLVAYNGEGVGEVMEGEPMGEVAYLQVLSVGADDAELLDELTLGLREELLELDVDDVENVAETRVTADAKGVAAALGGWLAVHFGSAGVRSVVSAVASWAGRTGKTVELTIGGDTLKLTGASSEMQSRLINEFFAHRAPTDLKT